MGRGTTFPHGSFTLAPRSPSPIRRPDPPYRDLPQWKGLKLFVVSKCGWCTTTVVKEVSQAGQVDLWNLSRGIDMQSSG